MKLNTREIQLEELNILKETIKFLNNNDIKYGLHAGTLLGAVRHKGFIPWDDDIDIYLTRPNYNKFIDCVKKEQNKIGSFNVISIDLNNSYIPFAKVTNPKIIIIIDWGNGGTG